MFAVRSGHEGKISGLDDVLQRLCPETELCISDVEDHFRSLARVEGYLAESFQFFYGTGDCSHLIPYIQLYHFLAAAASRVGNFHRHCLSLKKVDTFGHKGKYQ